LNLGISQYGAGAAASVEPRWKPCCGPTASPATREAKNALGGFVQPVHGCPALCGFPSAESHSITASSGCGEARKTPGKSAEQAWENAGTLHGF